ncbi:MAG: hypothetical protein R6U96_19210 [Promethearchaeia archaeon]
MDNKGESDSEEIIVICCVKNCQKKIKKNEAINIKGKNFCGKCGVAYYRSNLNF